MSLTPEWRSRIDTWKNTLKGLLYRKIADVKLEGFVTREQLTVQEAARRLFRPMAVGMRWGMKWEHAWFRMRVTVPREAAGKRVALAFDGGGEGLVFINGTALCSNGWSRRDIVLSAKGRPGERFDVIEHAYDVNCPATMVPGSGGERSLLRVTAPNIVIETVKPAQDGSGDMVVRLYEAKRQKTSCALECGFSVRTAAQTDMLEQNGRGLAVKEGKIRLTFRPFEVKTIRLTPGK